MPLMLVQAADPLLCRHLSRQFLSSEEQRQLAGLRHSLRAADFVTSRLISKLLLHRWFQLDQISASDLELRGAPGTPPSLYLHQQPLIDLHASVSHSRGLVLVGVRSGAPFGVDIEHAAGHDWTAIFNYMGWPLPAAAPVVSFELRCCCVWTIYEAGFKLFAGSLPHGGFQLHTMSFPAAADPSLGHRPFAFEAAFPGRRFSGVGLVAEAWTMAVALEAPVA